MTYDHFTVRRDRDQRSHAIAAFTVEAAILVALATLADKSDLIPDGLEPEQEIEEDFSVIAPSGDRYAYRLTVLGSGACLGLDLIDESQRNARAA